MVNEMLFHGASVRKIHLIQDREGKLPLHGCKHPKTARLLLSFSHTSDSLEQRDSDGFTPFLRAVAQGNHAVAVTLASLAAHIGAKTPQEKTALHLAASGNHRALVEFLMEKGLNPLDVDNEGKRASDLAPTEILKAFLESRAPHYKPHKETTATRVEWLHEALHSPIEPHFRFNRIPYTLAPDLVDIPDPKTGRTALHVVVDQSVYPSEKDLAKVLTHAPTINPRDHKGRIPLHSAKTANMAETLIHQGALVSVQDGRGRTPLHVATGADSYDKEKFSYLCGFLEINECSKAAECLLAYDAPADSADTDGITPLHLTRNKKTRRLLKEAGALVEARDAQRRTPLAFKAHHLFIGDCLDLLALGAKINTQDNGGRTPLIAVAARAHEFEAKGIISILRKLLDHRANRHALDHLGNSASDHAAAADGAIKEFLQRYKTVPQKLYP